MVYCIPKCLLTVLAAAFASSCAPSRDNAAGVYLRHGNYDFNHNSSVAIGEGGGVLRLGADTLIFFSENGGIRLIRVAKGGMPLRASFDRDADGAVDLIIDYIDKRGRGSKDGIWHDGEVDDTGSLIIQEGERRWCSSNHLGVPRGAQKFIARKPIRFPPELQPRQQDLEPRIRNRDAA